ncbi:MAG: PKD domain-containing protein [Candidatus Thermoplasmatota archaeon]|mgnify:FL=1|nr:PKD domain-containing protein [Candidatus Thermoplasmatota archaeon]
MKMQRGLFISTLLLVQLLAGCTSVLDSTVDPRASLTVDGPTEIQQGEATNFDGRQSDAIEGVITEYSWDFGDGEQVTSILGYVSHQFLKAGQFNVKLTVTNDQGGTDSTSVLIRVNGAPVINLSMPEVVRSGDIILLDASKTVDPEGGALDFMWDLNFLEDTNGDGDTRNDIDSTEPLVYLPTISSGSIMGSLTVDDNEGGVASQQFSIDVQQRRYKVSWVQNSYEWEFDDYLAQGETWTQNMTPGIGVRILSYDALLELDQDFVLPPDNFTLSINIMDDGHRRSAETTPGNITRNESTMAELNASNLNPIPEGGVYDSDSADQLLESLLNEPGARFGQGEWIWSVVAQNADPDSIVPGAPDPDTGNDWTLTIVIKVLTPILTEVAYD